MRAEPKNTIVSFTRNSSKRVCGSTYSEMMRRMRASGAREEALVLVCLDGAESTLGHGRFGFVREEADWGSSTHEHGLLRRRESRES
jgi:hypothetical protein